MELWIPFDEKMESGFEDDFAPMQSSNGAKEDDSFILNEEESPKKNSEGKKHF